MWTIAVGNPEMREDALDGGSLLNQHDEAHSAPTPPV
jgi:hypothetical protein